jgi:hypothetical protein
MSSSVSAASVSSAGQSPLLSLTAARHRKHPSMVHPKTQNAEAPASPAASSQAGSKVNITA